jgi:hypothetical protein
MMEVIIRGVYVGYEITLMIQNPVEWFKGPRKGCMTKWHFQAVSSVENLKIKKN